MGRPLRIEYPGAIYHVTSRGDRQEPIFRADADRQLLLAIVDQAMDRLDAELFAYCLMGNHYHFVLRTRQANLSRLMRHVNGEYTRAFNKRHQVVGHVFQGRYHSVLVDRDAYLIEVCRYVELNPVRAGLVRSPVEWSWCSYAAHVGAARGPKVLATATLHGHLLGHDVTTAEHTHRAERLYIEAVAAGRGVELWANHLRDEIFLGQEGFAAQAKAHATADRLRCKDIARSQRTGPASLSDWLTPDRTRDDAFRLAYSHGGMTMTEIARQAGLSVSSISKLIAAAENSRLQT
jgi:REP element-mobilizing transposase RayT